MKLTERIESVILSNLQPKEERKIGIECECILYNKKGERIPVNPSDELSATDIKDELEALQANDRNKAGFTIEPGGQIEWASPPLKSLHEINKKFILYKERLNQIAQREKLKTIDYSLEPLYEPFEIPIVDNDKYRLMNKMFMKTGSLGPWMMRNTASVQINIDFSSKEEAERMAYIGDCLTPISSILFANSPFWNGKRARKQNLRYKIWNDTDISRCGDLLTHCISSSENLISKYAEYIQTAPAIFVLDENDNIIKFRGTLGTWLSKLEKEGELTDEAIQIALHQIFTHVRFKNVIEIRGSDKPPAGFELAPAAFWVGLLLNDEIQEEIFNIAKEWTPLERRKLIESANYLDVEQLGPQNRSIKEWIEIVLSLSLSGLEKPSSSPNKTDETIYLNKYVEFFNKYGIPAINTQNLLEKSKKSVFEFIK